MKISVKVIPKSRHSEVKIDENVIKVWLHAAPDGGRANHELLLILADYFRVSRSSIKILAGFTTRNKIVDIRGINQLKAPDPGQMGPKDGISEVS
jgi:hypothetical protein